MTVRRFASLAALAMVVGTTVAVVPAPACTQPPVDPPIVVEFHEVCFPIDHPTHCMVRAWVTLLDYGTFAAAQGELCGCAFAEVGDIKEVLRAQLCDAATGDRLAEFAFDADEGVTQAMAEFTNEEAQGFVAELFDDVPAGTTVDLKFEVLLEGGKWIMEEDVAAAILTSSAPVVVTGEVDGSGEFIGHIGIVPPPGGPCSGGGCPCFRQGHRVFVNGAADILIARGETIDAAELERCEVKMVKPVGGVLGR